MHSCTSVSSCGRISFVLAQKKHKKKQGGGGQEKVGLFPNVSHSVIKTVF
jgi:hypothetical protein